MSDPIEEPVLALPQPTIGDLLEQFSIHIAIKKKLFDDAEEKELLRKVSDVTHKIPPALVIKILGDLRRHGKSTTTPEDIPAAEAKAEENGQTSEPEASAATAQEQPQVVVRYEKGRQTSKLDGANVDDNDNSPTSSQDEDSDFY